MKFETALSIGVLEEERLLHLVRSIHRQSTPQARYRRFPVASLNPSSPTRSCAARGVTESSFATMAEDTIGRDIT